MMQTQDPADGSRITDFIFIFQSMVEEDDEDNDGKISFEEFKKGVGKFWLKIDWEILDMMYPNGYRIGAF